MWLVREWFLEFKCDTCDETKKVGFTCEECSELMEPVEYEGVHEITHSNFL